MRKRQEYLAEWPWETIVLMFLIVTLVLIGVFWPHFSRSASSPENMSVSSETVTEEVPPSLPEVDTTLLRAEVETILAQYPEIDAGVVVHDIRGDVTVQIGQNESFEAASVAKLVTAMAYVYYIENGSFTLDDPVGDTVAREQIQRMLRDSDNVGWKLINDTITKPKLAEFAERFGAEGYDPFDNLIKPTDISKMLTALYTGQIVGEEYVGFLKANMQLGRERYQFVRNTISSDIAVYHKSGWLSDRVHEATIVDLAERPFVLVILSKTAGDYDFERGGQMFGEITRASLQSISAASQ